jgi:two-component system, response regulator, stage 0 sporulation protein F
MGGREGPKMNKILVVDDDSAIRMLYTEELIEEGYEVVAHDGAGDLMAAIRKESPDLVVLDIKLGQNSGLDLLRDIRNRYEGLPVILCSAYLDIKYDSNSVAPDYYVLKSSDMNDLKLKVKVAFEATPKSGPFGARNNL